MVVNSNTKRKEITTSRDKKQWRNTFVQVIWRMRVGGVSVVVCLDARVDGAESSVNQNCGGNQHTECLDVLRARRLSAENNGTSNGVYLECGGRENKEDNATKLDSSNRVRRTGLPRVGVRDEQRLVRCESVLDWLPLRFHVLKRLYP